MELLFIKLSLFCFCGSLGRNTKHLCDISVKSNFTFALIYLVHQGSEKVGFNFFFVQNLK